MDVQQAKQELRQCSFLMLEIRNVEEIIDEVIERKKARLDTQSMQLTDMPKASSCNFDKILGTMVSVEELELRKTIKGHNEKIMQVEFKINSIALSEERTILRMRYIQNIPFKKIGYKFSYSDRMIHLLHSRALKSYSMLT